MLGQSTVVGVEIPVVPLEGRTGGLFCIIPPVIGTDSDNIGMAAAQCDHIGQIIPKRHNTIFVQTDTGTIDPYFGCLSGTFELNEDTLPLVFGRQNKRFPVPNHPSRVLIDGFGIRFFLVESMRQRD